MRFSTTLAATVMALTSAAFHAAADELQCLSGGEAFGVGQYACLNVGDNGRLALCETAQDVMSWRTVQDECPGGEPKQTQRSVESAPNCLADAQSFGAGKLACLSVDGAHYLARCDLVLNNSSWTKVQDDCPGNPPLNAQQEPGEKSWKPLEKPREFLDKLLGRS